MSYLVVALFLLSFSSANSAELTQTDLSCVCDPHKIDGLEEPQRFDFGQFRGECIDSCHFRRARLLNVGEVVTFGNILNFGDFYKVSLRLSDLDKVEMGFERFLPAVSHVFLKFTLRQGASPLVLQDQKVGSKKTIKTRSLILSSEAVPPRGHHYQIFESYFENYLIATRLATGEEMERWASELKHGVTLYPLNLATEKIAAIFLFGLKNSNDTSLKSPYKLFTDNCSTRALKFIDVGIDAISSRDLLGWKKFEEALPLAGPLGTKRALHSRHLITD